VRIVDLRPWPVRVWDGRGGRGGPDAGPLARLAGAAADALVARRVAGRDPVPDGLRVVSVGNLAFGGTGKTPVTAALAGALAAAGHRGAVLTRGYGSAVADAILVDADRDGAGDEARLLARGLAPVGWPVMQARDRRRGLDLLAARLSRGAVVLLEDGHQTAGAGRDLDVLILDRWREVRRDGVRVLEPATGPVVPLGPWRESARGARRAGVWLVEDDDPPARGAGGQLVTGFRRELALVRLDGGAGAAPADGRWAALSGIARPERFEAGAAAVLGGPPRLAVRCVDHAPYGADLLARVVAAVRAAGAPLTVTTEKDWIKLADRWPADLPLAVARLTVRWTGARHLPDLVGELLGPAAGSEPPANRET